MLFGNRWGAYLLRIAKFMYLYLYVLYVYMYSGHVNVHFMLPTLFQYHILEHITLLFE